MKLVKLERKYYVDASGKKVPKGTKGAIEKIWESPEGINVMPVSWTALAYRRSFLYCPSSLF